MRPWAIFAALILPAIGAHAAPAGSPIQAGDVFEITRDVESSQKTNYRFSGSSTDHDTLVERVIGTSDAGVELEYDLAKTTSADARASQWQFPVRVLRRQNGPLQLLNRPELLARAAAWRKDAGLTEAACGHWYFTWTSRRVDCDPQSAIETVEAFDLGPENLVEGAPYKDAAALAPAPLKLKSTSPASAAFFVEMSIDPNVVRREEAEADVGAGEILRKPVTLEEALRARSAEEISGTIDITFETDAAGHVRRQTKVINLSVKKPGGSVEMRTATETLERKRIA